MSRPTIYDVAARAKVSAATVSNVLNAPARVKPETFKRVMAVIHEMNFVPKAEAVTYGRKGFGSIGVVGTFTQYASFNHRLAGVLDALRLEPYKITIFDQKDPQREGEHLAKLPITGHLDGLIVMSLPLSEQVADRLLGRNLHTVLIETDHPDFSSVEVDNQKGGRLAAEHLISKGRKKLAFIGEQQFAESNIILSSQRLKGYREALEAAGIGLPDEYVSLGTFDVKDATRQAMDLLQLPDRPDAIFCYSDYQAVGVLKAAKALGLKVPDDVAVMGFDDMEFADYLGLTTISQSLYDSGRIAAKLLMERIDHPEGPTQQVTLPVKVIQRETT
ncbi:LacI family DNA-binding transcriptional regulator [Deinococcus cellulosilyticus]|nr:LacI family DNA-binding transcriptional regulator [Deinococcus cellulosilyticus]